MKVRIKFSKQGCMKFIGHLDTMRYFQKAIRRAGLPVAYSGGFSPHMILSFAAPLGVGITSLGEYFDMELTKEMATDLICRKLNAAMVEGMEVLSARKVEEGKAGKAMSLVAAADYFIQFRENWHPETSLQKKIDEFCGQSSISVWKKTKRSEKEVDIRPFIYRMEEREGGIFLCLAAASSNYTKPELVMDTFFSWMEIELPPMSYTVERREIYALKGDGKEAVFVTLEDLGEEVE